MTQHTPWEADLEVGDALIDAQHREALALCDRLAGLCEPDAAAAFDAGFAALRALAREHFEAEAAWLTQRGDPQIDAWRHACDELDDLIDDVLTTEHFERIELQRFLTLWWVGHVNDMARRSRADTDGYAAGGGDDRRATDPGADHGA